MKAKAGTMNRPAPRAVPCLKIASLNGEKEVLAVAEAHPAGKVADIISRFDSGANWCMGEGVRYLFGDTETTGFNPHTGDRLAEMAFVEAVDVRRTGRVFHRYVNPCRKMPEEAFNVHGLSDDFLKDHEPFERHVDEMLAFTEGAWLVFHNSEFDERFLLWEVEKAGRKPNWKGIHDTLAMARKKFPGSQVSLDALIRRFGIDGSGRAKHGALIDSELLLEVYAHLTDRTVLQLGSAKAEPEAGSVAGVAVTGRIRQDWFPEREPLYATDEEFDRHTAFIEKTVPNAIWQGLYDAPVQEHQ